MHLDELGVAVLRAGLERAAGGAAGADHRHGRAAVDQSAAARGDDHRVGREGADFHGHQVLAHDAAARARVVEHGAEVVPGFMDFHFAGHAPAADLVVERVEQLLAGGGAGEGRALEQRAAEAALVAKALGRAIERDAETIHQVDDPGGPFGHFLDRRLMLQEVAAVGRVVEVQPLAVALLQRELVDAVDAALGTDAVRALDRGEAHQLDVDALFGQLHGGRQTGQPSTDDHYTFANCHEITRPRGLDREDSKAPLLVR